MFLEINPAFAQSDAESTSGFDYMQFLPLVAIFLLFYFLLIRPQQKKSKAHQKMLTAISRGDRVITSGGIIGSVSRIISDSELEIEIASGIKVRIVRSTIAQVSDKTEPLSIIPGPSNESGSPVKKSAARKKSSKSISSRSKAK
jgi:preprotein translocase subunit YajC